MIPIKREKTQWWLRRDPALHCVRGCPTAIIGRKARANSVRWLAGALDLPFLRGISSTEVAVGSAVGERFDAQGLQAGGEPSIQATNSGTAWRSPQRNRKLSK